MAESEEDCGTWGSRDKYQKERQISEKRNSPSPYNKPIEKRPFTNNQSPNKLTEPPFKRQRNNFGDDNNRRDNFDNRKNNYPNRKDNSDNFNNRFATNMIQPTEDTPNYPTQPPMLSFKQFLHKQDDNIEMDAAMFKYNEYKDSFVKKQLQAFFDAHCTQEWFREKYQPSFVEINKLTVSNNIASRKDTFMYLFERHWMNNVKLNITESDKILRLMDAIVILLEGGNENDLKILDLDSNRELSDEPRALHKTFSIFLRNLHPNVLRCDVESLVKPYPGFLRLALQDPTSDRKFFRRGWVTYDRTVNIKEICWNLNNIRLHDCDIGAIVNRELTQRVRPINVLTNHKPVMRNDIKMAAKLVVKFDKRHNLWPADEAVVLGNPLNSSNPLLRDITEYLVDEGSYEEEALLGGNLNSQLEISSSDSDPTNIIVDGDDKLATVLDLLIIYLRFVHSYDYYINAAYQIEDEMPHRCGIIHARDALVTSDRPSSLSLSDIEEYIKTATAKANAVLNAVDTLSEAEVQKMGHKNPDEVVDSFIAANTQELAQDKWLCPLSGKKFKGPDFVRKHIMSKHEDKVTEATQMALFFNNYIADVKRPQLPEHPTNRIGAVKTDGSDWTAPVANSNESRVNNTNDGYVSTERYGNYRGSSPNNRGDFGGRSNNFDNRGGNNGNNYRKNNFSGRGGRGRERNGGGSNFSRNVMSYRDLDAPSDD